MKLLKIRQTPTQQQETYETVTKDAQKRARQLRKQGHTCWLTYAGPNAEGIKCTEVIIDNVPQGVETPAPR